MEKLLEVYSSKVKINKKGSHPIPVGWLFCVVKLNQYVKSEILKGVLEFTANVADNLGVISD
jgi:hypothetical protein